MAERTRDVLFAWIDKAVDKSAPWLFVVALGILAVATVDGLFKGSPAAYVVLAVAALLGVLTLAAYLTARRRNRSGAKK